MGIYDILLNSYHEVFSKEKLHDNMDEFIQCATIKGLDIIDLDIIEKVAENRHFFFNILLGEILNILKVKHVSCSELEIEILIRDRDDYNANIEKDAADNNKYVLFIDGLMLTAVHSLVEVMIYWSMINRENVIEWTKCFKYTVFALVEYGKERIRPQMQTWVREFHIEMNTHSANTTHLFTDIFAVIITFIMLHEIGHLVLGHLNSTEKSLQHEFDADDFAYNTFLMMIKDQRRYIDFNKKRPQIDAYNEYTYLAPLMFFDIMELIEYFQSKAYGDATFHSVMLKLVARKKHLEDWVFNAAVNYNFDSDEGNSVYNAFLDSKERFISEVELKIQRGKKITPDDIV